MNDNRVNIPESRYLWAINRAGLSVDEFVSTHRSIPLHDWMSGEKSPTIKQLEQFAKSVHLPFGFLFVDNAPEEEIPFPLFRGAAGRSNIFDINVYDTVNIILKRQGWLEDYINDNEIDKCRIVNCITLTTSIDNAVSVLRNAMGLAQDWNLNLGGTSAVNFITERLEDIGVFVAFNGVVGNNNRRQLSVGVCRGFALVNETAPYIFVNSSDAITAQLFTLAHETAHIMLGVSAGHIADDTQSDDEVERYCDAVAAEFLVPASLLRVVWNGNYKETARRFHVSELVIARRLHDLKMITSESYNKFWESYISRQVSSEKRGMSGGDFYRTSLKRIGRTFAIHVKNAVNSEQLSYIEANRLTGLYGRTYTNFMNNKI